jgi:hypothetical protein
MDSFMAFCEFVSQNTFRALKEFAYTRISDILTGDHSCNGLTIDFFIPKFEAVVPSSIGSAVAVDAQFGNITERLYVIRPVESNPTCCDWPIGTRGSRVPVRSIHPVAVRATVSRFPLAIFSESFHGLRGLPIDYVIVPQPSGLRVSVGIQQKQHPVQAGMGVIGFRVSTKK